MMMKGKSKAMIIIFSRLNGGDVDAGAMRNRGR